MRAENATLIVWDRRSSTRWFAGVDGGCLLDGMVRARQSRMMRWRRAGDLETVINNGIPWQIAQCAMTCPIRDRDE